MGIWGVITSRNCSLEGPRVGGYVWYFSVPSPVETLFLTKSPALCSVSVSSSWLEGVD